MSYTEMLALAVVVLAVLLLATSCSLLQQMYLQRIYKDAYEGARRNWKESEAQRSEYARQALATYNAMQEEKAQLLKVIEGYARAEGVATL